MPSGLTATPRGEWNDTLAPVPSTAPELPVPASVVVTPLATTTCAPRTHNDVQSVHNVKHTRLPARATRTQEPRSHAPRCWAVVPRSRLTPPSKEWGP
eukprot:4922445-Prymnesium_polylepis.1